MSGGAKVRKQGNLRTYRGVSFYVRVIRSSFGYIFKDNPLKLEVGFKSVKATVEAAKKRIDDSYLSME